MIEIEFRIGGWKVSFDKGWDEVEAKADAEARKGIREYIQRKLAHVRCPEHGGTPRVAAEGPSWDDFELSVQGLFPKPH